MQSALLPNPAALIHLSAYLASLHARDSTPFPGCPSTDDLSALKSNDPPPGLTLSAQDLSDLRELHEKLIRICMRAQERHVCVILDAEYSWFQVRSARLLLLGPLYGRLSLGSQRSIPFPSL
jgi:proline dehydrogenase